MRELATIARHAGTVLAGQLAVMAFGVTDTIVAGRFSSDALASFVCRVGSVCERLRLTHGHFAGTAAYLG